MAAAVVFPNTEVAAQEAAGTAFEIIKDFRKDIYVLAERTGGSPDEWQQLEDDALNDLFFVMRQRDFSLTQNDENGRTALHMAAASGYWFFVEAMLVHDTSTSLLDMRDNDGLTAHEFAQIARPVTVSACHPKIENPFVLVPFMVLQPYYENRKPFPKIINAFLRAGADQSNQHAKMQWLETCSNSDRVARTRVENSANLFATLTTLASEIDVLKRTAEVEKKVEVYLQIIELLSEDRKPTAEELQEQIAQIYLDSRLVPPG